MALDRQTPANLQTAAIRSMAPAIVERLRQAFPEEFFAIERVPSTLNLEELKAALRQSPFIGLSWTGFKKDSDSGRILKGKHQWRLLLVVKASNGLEARFSGDHSDIGVDAMMDVAAALLQGHVMDGIGHVSVLDAMPVFAEGHFDDDSALAHINFEIDFAAPLGSLQLVDAAGFSALNVQWFATDPQTAEGDPPEVNQTIHQGA